MTDPLQNLTDHPEVETHELPSSDLLSHVLAQIRLTGENVYSRTLAKKGEYQLESGAAHICVVSNGAVRLKSARRDNETLDAGDLVLLPHSSINQRFVASSQGATLIVCRFSFDPHTLRAMIAALPPCIHISRAQGAEWLEGIVHHMLAEAADVQPGAALMISRLIDLLVIRTLRTWVHQGQTSGWLAGLSDPRIARALKAIHDQPLQRWSIESLAEIANLSRSTFSERFAALVGKSPLRYCNEWRLTLARDLLSQSGARVGEVGLSIGYESEAAFSRAYKALFGHSPQAGKDRSLSPPAGAI